TPRAEYYAVQSINNVNSLGSSVVTALPDIPDAPTTIGGEESIQVSNFTSGATLKLYLWNGTPVDTAAGVTDSSYTFANVVPNSLGFFVTQTVGSEESVNSAFTSVSLRAPVAVAGEDYVDVSNVIQGAQVELYDSDDNLISSNPQTLNDDTRRFAGLQTRKSYYAIQSINGITSLNSTFVAVNPVIPAAPTVSGGEEQLVVSGFEAGATLKLYLTDQTLLRTIPNAVGSTYTFENVVPNRLGFYVTQTVGYEESDNSTFADVSLRTPSASGGVRYVDISNVLEGASLALFDSNHTPIAIEPVDQGNGVWRYQGLNNGLTYYAIQSINGVSSLNTLFVTLPEPPSQPLNVRAVAGNGQAVITFTSPLDGGRSPITEYLVVSGSGDEVIASGAASPITVTGLSNGTSYTFRVIAVNEAGNSAASERSNAIIPWAFSSGNSSSSTAGVEVIVNGKSENIGRASYGFENGRSFIRIVADRAELQKRLESEGDRPSIVLPVKSASDAVIGQFDGELIRSMQLKQATIELRTEDSSYRLPTGQIPLNDIAEAFDSGVALEDIAFRIEIAKVSPDALARVENAARNGSFTIAAPPIEFSLYAVYGGKTHEITGFNVYVERTINLPAGADSSKITTGIVVEADGTVRHVPTRVSIKDNQYSAVINSLTNSTYAIVWNPIVFADVAGHWAQISVNDMGSRMVFGGAGNGAFQPEREVTRAEFAEILVKGLGLRVNQEFAASFSDVSESNWHNGYIHAAVSFDLLKGYGDGSFRPDQNITREQAVMVLAKAMSITGLKSAFSAADAEAALEGFADGKEISDWAKEGVALTLQAGLIQGKSRDRLAPKDDLTRAEAAVMIQRLLTQSDLINK
ncbi:S-layer homology domain-containing protein, partial [Paenibacillus sp. CAU 1782]